MPDIENLEEEQGAELDPEAEAAFNEEGESAGGDDQGGEEKQDEQGGTDEKEEGGDKDEKQESAAERAMRRADALDGGGAEDGKKDGQGKDADDKGDDKPAKITKEQVSDLLSVFTDDDIPSKAIIVGDTEIDLAAYAKDYPNEFKSNVVMAGIIAKRMVEKALKSGQYVSAEDQARTNADLVQQIERLDFWNDVMEVHPDARKIAKSAEFKEWMGKQPKKIQTLAERNNVEDAVAVIEFYKEDLAKKTVKDKDDKDREIKRKKDGLLSGGARSKPAPSKSKEASLDDMEAAFDEEVNEQANSRKR